MPYKSVAPQRLGGSNLPPVLEPTMMFLNWPQGAESWFRSCSGDAHSLSLFFQMFDLGHESCIQCILQVCLGPYKNRNSCDV